MSREIPIVLSSYEVMEALKSDIMRLRRPVKPGRHAFGFTLTPEEVAKEVNGETCAVRCQFGRPGDLLWVREKFALRSGISRSMKMEQIAPGRMGYVEPVWYAADGAKPDYSNQNRGRWRPGFVMPHWASRLSLRVTSANIEPTTNKGRQSNSGMPMEWVIDVEVMKR